MEDGIYKDLSITDYHKNDTHLSATGLKHAKRCMKDLWYYKQGYYESEYKEHFDLGNAFELALLEPDSFDDKVAIYNPLERPEPKKTFGSTKNKEWKENFHKENGHKYIISKDSFTKIEYMLDACYKDAVIKKLIKNIEYQYSCFWTCPKTGLRFKTRPDIAKINKSVLVDVKTIEDGSPFKFRSQAAKLDYFIQAITQIEGVQQAGLIEKVDAYYYLVVEKKPPYSAQLYQLPESEWGFLRDEIMYLFERVKKAQDQNRWPGYTDRADNKYGVLELTPPPYYSIYQM